MKRIDAHRTSRAASYKDVSGCKAAVRDAQDIADLRDRCPVRWDYASPAVHGEIEQYVEALLVARK
jgi:hypothetical protein